MRIPWRAKPKQPGGEALDAWEELQQARHERLVAEQRWAEAQRISERLRVHRAANSWERTFRRALGGRL